MSMRKHLLVLCKSRRAYESLRGFLAVGAVLLALGSTIAMAAEGPGLGHPLGASELAVWDISIGPDGAGLPPGSGTPAAGEAVFRDRCLGCHGESGAGKPNDRLVGGRGTLNSAAPVKTVGSYWPYATTLFDYVRQAMPFNAPKSLTDSEVYAVTAYLLSQNGIIPANQVVDAGFLPAVIMPNRNGFTPFTRGR